MSKDVFKYPDTNSSRANIEFLNEKFYDQKIAIIGLGGTGSYILDHVAKVPVKEIHLFDGDLFQLHNAFRAPGAISGEKLDADEGLKKVDYYKEIYSRMHGGIIAHDVYVTNQNISLLGDFNMVFVAVDKNSARSMISKELLKMKVSFIDVGLGVNLVEESLLGTIRVTVATAGKHDHLNLRIGSDESDENEYGTNIQISDLNCLNAVLAVRKWKQISGFYQDLKGEHNTLYFINTGKIINEDFGA